MLTPDFDFCEECKMLKELDEENVRTQLDIKDSLWQDLTIDSWVFHSDEKSKDFVEELFVQQDSRYRSDLDNSEDEVACFIYHNAINIEKVEALPNIPVEHNEFLTEPQKEDKERAVSILEGIGYNYIGQEIRVKGGVADIFMQKDRTKAVVECRSVTVSKGIECLSAEYTELWIFSKEGSIYKLTRGRNWDKMHKFYVAYQEFRKRRIWNRMIGRSQTSY